MTFPDGRFHVCPIEDCIARVPESRLMCPPHWRLVPKDLADELYRAWRRGTVIEHGEAMQACVDAVHRQLGVLR